MTEKIKHKNAYLICALVNGDVVQIFIRDIWQNISIDEDGFISYGPINTYSFSIFFNEGYKFRIKHIHQDIIDQCEADPSLEIEQAMKLANNEGIYRWREASKTEMKNDIEANYQFRIKEKPEHPHQKLIDMIERWEFEYPCYVQSENFNSEQPCISYCDNAELLVKELKNNPITNFKIFTLAAESKGEK